MKPVRQPIWRAAMAAVRAGNAWSPACPGDIGRRRHLSPRSASMEFKRLAYSTAQWMDRAFAPMSSSSWFPSCDPAISSSWTICPATGSLAFGQRLKARGPNYVICRPTVPTSIPSSNSSPSSKRSCERLPREQSMPSWRRSPKLSQSLVRRNAGTISQTKAIATYYESALIRLRQAERLLRDEIEDHVRGHRRDARDHDFAQIPLHLKLF